MTKSQDTKAVQDYDKCLAEAGVQEGVYLCGQHSHIERASGTLTTFPESVKWLVNA